MKLEKLLAVAALSLLIYTLALSFFNTAVSPPSKNNRLGSAGAIRARMPIVAYSDPQGNYTLSSVEWGILDPGESKNATCYIKNWDKVPLTLSFITQNWNPSEASNYISLNWNYNGQPVNATQVVEVILTLSVSPSVPDLADFSFDIVIIGTA